MAVNEGVPEVVRVIVPVEERDGVIVGDGVGLGNAKARENI